ncbi:glycoside hydrolase family 36 protein [Candidatus Poribacteria bacterium]
MPNTEGKGMLGAVKLQYNDTILMAKSRIELLISDEVIVPELRFGKEETCEKTIPGFGIGTIEARLASCEGFAVTQEVFRPKDGSPWMAIRLLLENTGTEALSVTTLTPVFIEKNDLKLGDVPASKWAYVRQPRYKNDMPASAILGDESPMVWDATRGTRETGGWNRRESSEYPNVYISSELTAVHTDDASVVLGVLPLDKQLVRSYLELTSERNKLKCFRVDCQCDNQRLSADDTLISQWVMVDLEPDTFSAIQRYAEALGGMTRSVEQSKRVVKPRPTVWCSWYYYGDMFTQSEAEGNLEALEKCHIPFDVFQIDECWDKRWGDWSPNSDWPDLTGVAQRIRNAGYIPGIWTCAFLMEPRSRTAYHHPEWWLRKRDGSPVRFSMNNMQNLVLDTTRPDVLEFIEQLYRWLTHELGFVYHKVDFTRAVVIDPDVVFHDQTKNRAEAYRMGIGAIRRGIGEDAYLNVCGGLYGANIGLVDAQRTGSDVKSMWPEPPEGEEQYGYGPFTIKQNTLRYWWNRFWDNDPDALMVRRRSEAYRSQSLSLGLMSDVEAMTSALNQYLGGGLVCFTENLAEVDPDRLWLLRHCSPSVENAAIPRDGLDGKRFPSIFDTHVKPQAEELQPWHTISLVNWLSEPRSFSLTMDHRLLGGYADTSDTYMLSAFSGKWNRKVSADETVQVGPIPPHGCEVIKVQPVREDEPMLLHTNGHFSMGGQEIATWEVQQSKVRLAVAWKWPVPLEITLLPPRGHAFEENEVDEAVTFAITDDAQYMEYTFAKG